MIQRMVLRPLTRMVTISRSASPEGARFGHGDGHVAAPDLRHGTVKLVVAGGHHPDRARPSQQQPSSTDLTNPLPAVSVFSDSTVFTLIVQSLWILSKPEAPESRTGRSRNSREKIGDNSSRSMRDRRKINGGNYFAPGRNPRPLRISKSKNRAVSGYSRRFSASIASTA